MATLAPKLPYLHPFAGGFPYRGSQRLPSDPDALAYLAAVAAADGAPVEVGVATAVDDFIKGCKADPSGIPGRSNWDAIKASCILCGARTLAGALVPLAGTAPTNNNFLPEDYNRETGLKGNGSTKFLDSNRAPDSLPQNDIHISGFISSLPSASSAILFTNYPTSATGMFVSLVTNVFAFHINSTLLSTGIAAATGFFGASRSAATITTQRVAAADTPSSVVSGTRKTDSIRVFNDATEAATYASDARLAFYSIGEAISDLALLDARVTALVQRIQLSLSTGLDASGYDDATVAYLLAAYNNGATLE